MELAALKITRQYRRQGKGTNLFTAVQETDLVLPAGRLIEVEGRSGSGKSTLLNMMAGLLAPTTGRVLLDGQDLYALSDRNLSRVRNRSLGVIPQGQTGLRALTVLENVLLPAMLYESTVGNLPAAAQDPGQDKKKGEKGEKALPLGRPADLKADPSMAGLRSRAEELLEKVGIAHLQEVWPDQLSGGELRRLAIARALILDPGVILADEPTADLDDENTGAVLSLLRDCADAGKAVLLVTHERDAAAYADEVYRMNEGVLTRL